MSFIKNEKKTYNRIIAFFLFLVMLLGLLKGLNYLLCDVDKESLWFRHVWKQYADEEENIDTIFVGSSHVYSAVNPLIFDEECNTHSFDLATSSQKLNDSYYLIKQAAKDNDVKTVYLEVNYFTASKKTFDNDEDVLADASYLNWGNTDYMPRGKNRLEYILDYSDITNIGESIFAFARYHDNALNLDYMKNVMSVKLSENYRNDSFVEAYEDGNGVLTYGERGFNSSTREWPKDEMTGMISRDFKEDCIGEKSETYLRKCIEFCQENDIEIVLFTAPTSDIDVLSTGNYDYFANALESIASEYGIEHYDFNLAKDEVLPFNDTQYFLDCNHLNEKGATLFSEVLAKMASGKLSKEDVLYSSYEEKRSQGDYQLFGLLYHDQPVGEGTQMRDYYIAANRADEATYTVVFTSKFTNEEVVLLEDSSETHFVNPTADHGTFVIKAKPNNGSSVEYSIESNY